MGWSDFWDNIRDPETTGALFAEIRSATAEMVHDVAEIIDTDGRELLEDWGKVVEVLDTRLGDE